MRRWRGTLGRGVFGWIAVGAAVALAACGSSSGGAGGGSTTTTTTTTTTTPGAGAQPPAAGAMNAGDGVTTAVFAATRMDLGVGTPGSSEPAWSALGFDIDGQASTALSSGLCEPRAGATADDAYPDGERGIDNAFGKSVVSMLLQVQPKLAEELNKAIAEGSFTLLLAIDKLGASADYNPLAARAYGASALGQVPVLDGDDVWPISRGSLADPSDPTSVRVRFPASYLVGNTWVSGPRTDFAFRAWIGGAFVDVALRAAVVSMELDAAHKTAKRGVISGVWPTAQLVTLVRRAAGGASKVLCSGALIENIVKQIEAASDILQDGTQDPGKPCDGISIGLGFEATAARLGDLAPAEEQGPDPCAP